MQLQRGGAAAGLGSSRNCWKREFPREKKLPRQKARQKLGVWQGVLAPSRVKATSQVPFSAAPPAPQALPVGGNCGAASGAGAATSRSLSAVGYTCTHKQGRSQLAAWQAPSTTWQGSECPAGPQGPLSVPLPDTSGSVLALPVSRTYGEVPCASDLLLSSSLDLKGSLELPTGFLAGMELLQPGTAIPSTVTHKGTGGP